MARQILFIEHKFNTTIVDPKCFTKTKTLILKDKLNLKEKGRKKTTENKTSIKNS